MKYDLKSHIDRERFNRRCSQLIDKQSVVELVEKNQRTLKQNSYLHLIMGYLAVETGNTLEYVKREFFKIECNRELFVTKVYDNILKKETMRIRSSSDLTSEEMTQAIERFRNWSATIGYYLPTPDEHLFLTEIEIEIERNKQYL